MSQRKRVLDLSGLKGKVSVGSKARNGAPTRMYSRRPELANVKAKARPGHRPGIPNGLESEYAHYLAAEVAAGRVKEFHFESHKFLVSDDARSWWTPDFEVIYADGRVEFVDTKGMKRPTQQLKAKLVAGRYMAYYFVVVEKAKGEWKRKPIEPKREVNE
jgi:hypothetical protein